MADQYRETFTIREKPPYEPRPEVFAFREVVNPMDRQMAGDDKLLFDRLKRKAAQQLAQMIFEHCHWFEIPVPMTARGELALQLELSIADRGRYERWLPDERRRGRAEGLKAAKDAMPYGFDEAYE